MKKFLSLILVILLSLSLFAGCDSDYQTVEDNTVVIDGITYATDTVLVVINEEYADKKYTAADFDKKLVKSVKVIFESKSGELLMLSLKLRHPGEENLHKVIEIAESKPEVKSARPDQVITYDLGVSK